VPVDQEHCRSRKEHPDRFIGCVHLPLTIPASLEELTVAWLGCGLGLLSSFLDICLDDERMSLSMTRCRLGCRCRAPSLLPRGWMAHAIRWSLARA
jgi:hypothetical protein